jgi:hypothetical protein
VLVDGVIASVKEPITIVSDHLGIKLLEGTDTEVLGGILLLPWGQELSDAPVLMIHGVPHKEGRRSSLTRIPYM